MCGTIWRTGSSDNNQFPEPWKILQYFYQQLFCGDAYLLSKRTLASASNSGKFGAFQPFSARRPNGRFSDTGWADDATDATGLTLIPLNMSEPVLVVRGKDAGHGLGFSPHGAGRNFSRAEHKRRMGSVTADQMLKAETEGRDIRFFAGGVDASELPSSYKSADNVVAQVKSYDLAEIEDNIRPVSLYDGRGFAAVLERQEKGAPIDSAPLLAHGMCGI